MIRKPTPSLSLSCARCFTRELLRSRIIIIVTIVVKVVKKEFHLAIEGLSQIAQSNERKWEQKKKQRKTAQSFTSQSETAKKNTMHVVHTSRQKKKNERKKNRKEKIIKTQTWLDTKFTSVATALQLFPLFSLFLFLWKAREERQNMCSGTRTYFESFRANACVDMQVFFVVGTKKKKSVRKNREDGVTDRKSCSWSGVHSWGDVGRRGRNVNNNQSVHSFSLFEDPLS